MSSTVGVVIVAGIALVALLMGVLIYLLFLPGNNSAAKRSPGGGKGLGDRLLNVRAQPVLPQTFSVQWIGIALAIVLLTGAGAGYLQWRLIREADLLRTQGVVVQGLVTDKHVVHSAKAGNTYYVYYTFTPREIGSSPIEDGGSVFSWVYSSVREGGPVDILYVRGEPEIHRFKNFYTLGDFNALPGIVGSGIVLLALFFMWMLIRELDRGGRLDRDGVEGRSRVMDLLVETSAKGELTYYVVYEVPQSFVVRHTISREQYDRLKVGMAVAVRYVPDDPKIFQPEWEFSKAQAL